MSGQRRSFFIPLLLTATAVCTAARGVSLQELIHRATRARTEDYAEKRAGACAPWEPFQCPGGECIPIKYLCDGSPDCGDGYDENEQMCTAAVRPPVTDTANFLNSLLAAHGKNFLAKIFGDKAKDNLTGMGGVEEVAVALSQNPTAESFGVTVGMSPGEVTRMKKVMKAIADGNTDGFQGSEASDFRFFAVKLIETGF